MSGPAESVVFGPLPSRRFGQSLGINNIAGKRCAYACVYCQAGVPAVVGYERARFHAPEQVASEVAAAVLATRARGGHIDHLTFAPDGEPTLDAGLGRTIELLRPIGIPVVVLTNGVLVGDPGVAADLAGADWVSLKVDAVTPRAWHLVNRPARRLELQDVHDGMIRFRHGYRGRLTTETMLVDGFNTAPLELEAIAGFVASLTPDTAYVAVPTRPPASVCAHVPHADAVFGLCSLLERRGVDVVRLTGDAPEPFDAGGNLAPQLLGILAVHPMQRGEVEQLVDHCGAAWSVVEDLVARGEVERRVHLGREFFVGRRTPRP